jgi:hypothetical protein
MLHLGGIPYTSLTCSPITFAPILGDECRIFESRNLDRSNSTLDPLLVTGPLLVTQFCLDLNTNQWIVSFFVCTSRAMALGTFSWGSFGFPLRTWLGEFLRPSFSWHGVLLRPLSFIVVNSWLQLTYLRCLHFSVSWTGIAAVRAFGSPDRLNIVPNMNAIV